MATTSSGIASSAAPAAGKQWGDGVTERVVWRVSETVRGQLGFMPILLFGKASVAPGGGEGGFPKAQNATGVIESSVVGVY